MGSNGSLHVIFNCIVGVFIHCLHGVTGIAFGTDIDFVADDHAGSSGFGELLGFGFIFVRFQITFKGNYALVAIHVNVDVVVAIGLKRVHHVIFGVGGIGALL